MAYYLYDGKGAIGPFEPADLVKRPGFGATTLVFPVGATAADAWKPAASFADISSALKPSLPPPPPPPAAPAPTARTEITLSLPPLKPREPDPPPVVAPAPAPVAAPAPAASPAFASPSDKLVMVIDDDESVRSFIEMSAATQGFQVVTAVNGRDASAKLAEKPADLIVTDLMMPEQGGYEFLRALQAAGGPRVPVFVVTGSSLDASTIKMIRQEASVVEFIAKPIRIAAFIAALHKHLGTAPRA